MREAESERREDEEGAHGRINRTEEWGDWNEEGGDDVTSLGFGSGNFESNALKGRAPSLFGLFV